MNQSVIFCSTAGDWRSAADNHYFASAFMAAALGVVEILSYLIRTFFVRLPTSTAATTITTFNFALLPFDILVAFYSNRWPSKQLNPLTIKMIPLAI